MRLCMSLFPDLSPHAGTEALHSPVRLMSIISKAWGNLDQTSDCEAAHSTATRAPRKPRDVPVKK